MLKITRLPIGGGKIIDGGAARFECRLQHIAHGWHKAGNACRAHIGGFAARANARQKQSLAHIYIAQPRHNALVKQSIFNWALAMAQSRAQHFFIKIIG